MIDFIIDAEERTVFMRGDGVVNAAQFSAHIRELKAHYNFQDGMCQLSDLRTITYSGSIIDLRGVASTLSERHLIAKSATVVNCRHHAVLARLLFLYSRFSPNQHRVFFDIDEACLWLGVRIQAGRCLRYIVETDQKSPDPKPDDSES